MYSLAAHMLQQPGLDKAKIGNWAFPSIQATHKDTGTQGPEPSPAPSQGVHRQDAGVRSSNVVFRWLS